MRARGEQLVQMASLDGAHHRCRHGRSRMEWRRLPHVLLLYTVAVSILDQQRILQQPILPLAQANLMLNQAAQDARMLGQADRVAPDQHVAAEFQPEVLVAASIAIFHPLPAPNALPLAEG